MLIIPHLKDLETLPAWLNQLADMLVCSGVVSPELRPNTCLINEYLPGQGIMAHEDGPRYWPHVLTLSLGSPATLVFHSKLNPNEIGTAREPVMKMILQPRSLVIFSDLA